MFSLLERLRMSYEERIRGICFQLFLARKRWVISLGGKGMLRVYACPSGFINVDVYSLYITHSFPDKTSCHAMFHFPPVVQSSRAHNK
jgi:hypothetical protein